MRSSPLSSFPSPQPLPSLHPRPSLQPLQALRPHRLRRLRPLRRLGPHRRALFCLLSLLCLLLGCAHDVTAHYPTPPTDPSGTLVLQMGQPASDVSVAINGLLVVDSVHTQRVVIDGVPIGTAEIVMTANGVDRQFHLWIGGEHPITVPLGVPDPGSGFLKSLFGTIVTIVLYSMLHR